MKQLATKILVLLTLMSPLSAFAFTEPLKDVPLTWKPTDDVNEIKKLDLDFLQSKHFKLGKITDARKVNPITLIGTNSEDPKNPMSVTTTDNVADFVRAHLIETFKKIGIDMEDKNPQYTLNGEIKEYFVEETNTYSGILTIKLEIKKGDTVVLTRTVSGTNKRFGRSYKLDNYMETLSDSLMDYVKEFVSSQNLAEKLK